MKKVKGYNFSRSFMGERVPQHVQNIVIKDYCQKNGLKMFAFVERLIKERCKPKTDIYGDEVN